MKKAVLGIFMMLALGMNNSNAQSHTLVGTTFKQNKSSRTSAKKDTLITRYTFEYNGGTYPVIINKKTGSCYIWGKKRDGKLTQKYIGPEYSAPVAKAYGIEYKPRTKKGGTK